MSDVSQGPGWWQASDGRWYAPALHPSQQQPAAPPPPSQSAVGGSPPPDAPLRTGLSGGQKVAIALVAVLVLGLGGCAVALGVVAKRGVTKIEQAAADLGNKDGCPFLSAARAASVLGSTPTLVPLRGFGALAGIALDTRVLADADSCMFTPASDPQGPTGRIARRQTGDAAKVFAAEKTQAKGVTIDQGNGLSTESMSYLLKDVDAGDEAFCTAVGAFPMSGALVRKGDVLVYAAVLPSQAQLDTLGVNADGTGLNVDEANCELATKLAVAVLAG